MSIVYPENNNKEAGNMAPRLRQDLISDPVHAARVARERLQQEGELPCGYLRDEIEASWRRSLDAGLTNSSQSQQLIDEVNDLKGFSSATRAAYSCGHARNRAAGAPVW